MTVTSADVEALARDLTSDQLAHTGASFTARAAERRRSQITEAEAWKVYLDTDDISVWAPCQRVRRACEILIGLRGYHPEQVIPAMTAVAEFVIDWPPAVVKAAVEAGCADGMAFREGLR